MMQDRGRLYGSSTVVAAAGALAKREAALALGADVAIGCSQPDWRGQVHTATEGRGADLVHVYSRSLEFVSGQGRYGQTAGQGWYDDVGTQRRPLASAAVDAEAQRLCLPRRTVGGDEIVDRPRRTLAEECVQRAFNIEMIDVIDAAGDGLPRWRAGPMFQPARRGSAEVRA